MIYWDLFIAFLQVGLFSFGGGYAALPLIQDQVINIHGWMNMSDFNNLITISQMTPGPIALNSATFIGVKVGGLLGALVATLGCILPSLIIVSTIAFIYVRFKNIQLLQSILKGLRPAVVALIATSGLTIIIAAINLTAIDQIKFQMIVFFAIGLYLLRIKKMDPIKVMVACGILQLAYGILCINFI